MDLSNHFSKVKKKREKETHSASSSPSSIMEVNHKAGRSSSSIHMSSGNEEDVADLRRGPWTVDEDLTLINHIANHGEGRWNSLARNSGLKRTGKSCRLRWLNYLHPDVRRGNITLEEHLLILELHSQWGNQWSKIAQHLPGRTDNEIKNYWRTRVQKQTKQLKCDVSSRQFKAAAAGNPSITSPEASTITAATIMYRPWHPTAAMHFESYTGTDPENSCTTPSSSEYSNPFYNAHEVSDPNNNEYYPVPAAADGNSFGEGDRGNYQGQSGSFDHSGYFHQLNYGMEFQAMDHHHHHHDHHHQQQNHHDNNDQIQLCWSGDGGRSPPDNLWNNVVEDVNYWCLQNSGFDP